jgi:hypothetical protein
LAEDAQAHAGDAQALADDAQACGRLGRALRALTVARIRGEDPTPRLRDLHGPAVAEAEAVQQMGA